MATSGAKCYGTWIAVPRRGGDLALTQDKHTPSFAERLDELFRTVLNPANGKQYSVRHVAQACGISHTHLNKLRSGAASNPRRSEMEALAGFFGVALSYFTDDAGAPAVQDRDEGSQARLAAALSHPEVEKVALRMVDRQLSPEGVAAVVAIIDEVARLEAAQRRRARGATEPDATAPE
jgi:ESX-1-secreted protein regulator